MDKNQAREALAKKLARFETAECSKEQIASAICLLREGYGDDKALIDEDDNAVTRWGLEEVKPLLPETTFEQRNLNFYTDFFPIKGDIASVIAVCAMPIGYNNFIAIEIVDEMTNGGDLAEKFPDARVAFGREGSVGLLLDFGGPNTPVGNYAHKWGYRMAADETSHERDKDNFVYRFWWD